MERINKYYDARDGTVKYKCVIVLPSGEVFECNDAASPEEARENIKQQGYDRFCNLIPTL